MRNVEENRKSSNIEARTTQYNVNNVFFSNFLVPDVQAQRFTLGNMSFFLAGIGERECKHVDRVFVVEDNRCRYSTAGVALRL